MQAAQTMWAYTREGKMVCAYDYIWHGFFNETHVVSEVAMRADTMVSAADLETAAANTYLRWSLVGNTCLPLPGAMRTLTSIVWPEEGKGCGSTFEELQYRGTPALLKSSDTTQRQFCSWQKSQRHLNIWCCMQPPPRKQSWPLCCQLYACVSQIMCAGYMLQALYA